jgi:glycosyltransferase involved in cell wall biosynthesis
LNSGLVSVVVPSYNHPEFLDRRMESLLAQTYARIEIIVIDDCSTANNIEILQKYLSDPRVRLVARKENGGVTAVTNQGVTLADGEFLIFAQCDDACDARMIERLVAAVQAQPSAALAFSRSLMIDEHDCVIGDDFTVRENSFRRRCAVDTLIDRREMRRFLLHSCVIPNLSGVLFRRSCFADVGLFSSAYRACLDWDLFFRLCDRYDFCYVAEPLNHFRQHGATIRSATKGRVTYDEFFRLLLGEIRHGDLSACERFRYRLHVMYLWSVELIGPSLAGWSNFFHHARQVWRLDPVALPLLPLALLQRLFELPTKIIDRIVRKARPNAA